MFKNSICNPWDDHFQAQSLKYEILNLRSEVTRLKKSNDLLQQQKKCLETQLNRVESKLKKSVDVPAFDDNEIKHKIECATCVVCTSNLKSVLYVECRHLSVCIKCSELLDNTCPLCRTISKKVTIFY